MRRQRERQRKTAAPSRRSHALGAAAYVGWTCALSWASAFLLRDAWGRAPPELVTRLLGASLLYAATMGWQPLAAAWIVRRWHEPRRLFSDGSGSAGCGSPRAATFRRRWRRQR